MDIFSAIVVVVPLILPLADIYGIDDVHLGIIFIANLELGFLHPPLGLNLLLASVTVQEAGARGHVGDAADARHPRDWRAAHHLCPMAHAGNSPVDGSAVITFASFRHVGNFVGDHFGLLRAIKYLRLRMHGAIGIERDGPFRLAAALCEDATEAQHDDWLSRGNDIGEPLIRQTNLDRDKPRLTPREQRGAPREQRVAG